MTSRHTRSNTQGPLFTLSNEELARLERQNRQQPQPTNNTMVDAEAKTISLLQWRSCNNRCSRCNRQSTPKKLLAKQQPTLLLSKSSSKAPPSESGTFRVTSPPLAPPSIRLPALDKLGETCNLSKSGGERREKSERYLWSNRFKGR